MQIVGKLPVVLNCKNDILQCKSTLEEIMKWLMLILTLIFFGCGSHIREYEDAVSEIVGRTISFPGSLQSLDGITVAELPKTDFTILAYYDSEGCTSCRMGLQLWNRFMQEIDSVCKNTSVRLIIITADKNNNDLRNIARISGFNNPIMVDGNNEFVKNIKMPDNHNLRTFLLDRENQVVLIGNPITNTSLRSLYVSLMKDADIEMNDCRTYSYDFGIVRPNQKVEWKYNLVNFTPDTLKFRELITSCECTTGRISDSIIAPYKDFWVYITYKDTIYGDFSRTLIATFENHADITLEISGSVR